MTYEIGSLVRVRGREWVVLPDSLPGLLLLRPLGGTDDESAGVVPALEPDLAPARFDPPDPARDVGDHRQCSLLLDAVRLGFRAGDGPFRSLARISVEPRPYQLVPLLMALRMDPVVRLLIADDVGVGKTIESLLIARELWDRGEVRRVAVLCPPHLAEAWHAALREQFHLDAELVLPATAARLERGIGSAESIFRKHRVVVVSVDFIKRPERMSELIDAYDLFIVDEAHGCVGAGARGSAQRRFDLVSRIAAHAPARHLILVTATPHAGDDTAFQRLLGLLDPRLGELPADLSGPERRKDREFLARHLVQRQRGDLERYLDISTPFPKREVRDRPFLLTKPYRDAFRRVRDWCREPVADPSGRRRLRLPWWSALSLLRALSSSPAAALASLRNLAEESSDAEERATLDLADHDDEADGPGDLPPAALPAQEAQRAELGAIERVLAAIAGEKADAKLHTLLADVGALLDEGFSPVVFCRFIPTVHYVVEHLRKRLPDAAVEAVTGELAPEARVERIEALAGPGRRVLVCTDCLSEGVNLQKRFNAVVHYDLSWNPTRHEQREGRVDRYGQVSDRVRAVTLYGQDNPMDGAVLKVILRKHEQISTRLGVSVPAPERTAELFRAVMEADDLWHHAAGQQLSLNLPEAVTRPFDDPWQAAKERGASRTIYAQHGVRVEEVRAELDAARAAMGDAGVVARFTRDALRALGAVVDGGVPLRVAPGTLPRPLAEHVTRLTPRSGTLRLVFRREDEAHDAVLVGRTHPLVEALSAWLVEGALDPAAPPSEARRCGVIRTRAVDVATTVFVLRLRFHLVLPARAEGPRELLAEALSSVAFRGGLDDSPERLDDAEAARLVEAIPDANVPPDVASARLDAVRTSLDALRATFEAHADRHALRLAEAHTRVRQVTREGARGVGVVALRPVDVLGYQVLLPFGEL